MIARWACLVVALAILGIGISEASLALVVVATALTALLLARIQTIEPGLHGKALCTLPRNGRGIVSRAMLLAVGAAGLSSVAVALGSGDSLVGLSVLAWLLSMGLLVALGLTLDRLTLRGMLAAVRSLFSEQHRPELGSALVITGVALVLRAYDLELVPAFFHEDEGELAKIALDILSGSSVPFFRTAASWGPAYPYTYLEAASIWLFGSTATGARMVSVLAGVLCVPVVYGIGRVGWGPVAAAIAAWLLAVSHLHIHYSRLAHGYMVATLLTATTMLFLVLAARLGQHQAESVGDDGGELPRRTGRGFWTLIIAVGAMTGISQHFYHATRIVPMIVGVLLVVMLSKRLVGRWHIEVLAFAFLVTYAPLGVTYLERPGDFFIGLREISALRNWYVQELFGPGSSLPAALPALMAEQLRRTLGLFVKHGDLSGYYPGGSPAFDVVTVALIWLGLGAALSRFRRFDEAALLVWIGFGAVFGNAVTIGAENGHRILVVTPAVCVLGGVAVARIWELLQATPLLRTDWLAAPAGTALALWLLAANVVIYFFEYTPRVERAESTYMAREMRERGDRYHYYFLTQPYYEADLPSVRYIANQAQAENIKKPEDLKPPPDDGKGILVLALPNNRDALTEVERRLPGGEEREVMAQNGRSLYLAYEVAPTR